MAYELFLHLPGIEDIESDLSDPKNKGWISLYSFGHSVDSFLEEKNGSSKKKRTLEHRDLYVVKQWDSTSPLLALACCQQDKFDEVSLQICSSEGAKQKFAEIKLFGATISSYRPGGSSMGGDEAPMEEVSFDFEKIEWTHYTKSRKPRYIKASWDLKKKKGNREIPHK